MENNEQELYQEGWKAGEWTEETLKSMGWPAAKYALMNLEDSYELELEDQKGRPDTLYERCNKAYQLGVFESGRESLKKLIEKGY